MNMRTCVLPSGRFRYGIHRPCFKVKNLRETDATASLGSLPDGQPYYNSQNFPAGDLEEAGADWIYEVPNPFPFRGATYITKFWADRKADDLSLITMHPPCNVSLTALLKKLFGETGSPEKADEAFKRLPEPLLLALASVSTDPDDLVRLAELSCEFVYDDSKSRPAGLKYAKNAHGRADAAIKNRALFEAVVNNIHLPDDFKKVMVLRPGAQGGSEIVGEWLDVEGGHVFEYLRRNSYIPWGHYASNMADDAVRYRISDLSPHDMRGLRHLYYQRTYVRLAEMLGVAIPDGRRRLSDRELETLRKEIQKRIARKTDVCFQFNATLWGWNFGFDFAPSGYRLHGSHQQVHQQFALIPACTDAAASGKSDNALNKTISAFGCGDLVADFISDYKSKTGQGFFECYLKAIRTNTRMDGRADKESSLVVYEDKHVMVFVPKAQTSQWELQLMPLENVGNILEADSKVRESLDRAMLITMNILTLLGARMVTVIEYSKRFDAPDNDQRLLYSFLPKLPESPGSFTEAQLRWINGHYPEDFAAACRLRLKEIQKK